MSLPVVILDLTLRPKAFVDVLRTRATTLAARYTVARFSLAGYPMYYLPQTTLSLAAPTPLVQWSAPKLIVHGSVRIIVRSKISSGILPLSISFWQVRGPDDARGLFNFPVTSRTMGMDNVHYFLGIDDLFYLHGPADSFVWKCCVVIQRKDGSIGIIDPHIENQD